MAHFRSTNFADDAVAMDSSAFDHSPPVTLNCFDCSSVH